MELTSPRTAKTTAMKISISFVRGFRVPHFLNAPRCEVVLRIKFLDFKPPTMVPTRTGSLLGLILD